MNQGPATGSSAAASFHGGMQVSPVNMNVNMQQQAVTLNTAPSPSPQLQRSMSDSLAFSGGGGGGGAGAGGGIGSTASMAGSPRSFSSANSMPGLSSGNSRFSVNPQNAVSAVMLTEMQELHHHQQQQTLANTVSPNDLQQFSQDMQQLNHTQKDLQPHHHLQLHHHQQQQQQPQLVQRIGSMSHLQSQQQGFGQSLAPVKMEQAQTYSSLQSAMELDQMNQQQAQAMASSVALQQVVKMEQEQMNQHAHAMASSSVKMETSLDLPSMASTTNVKREPMQSQSGSINLTSIPNHLSFPSLDLKPELDHVQSNPNVQQSLLTSHLQRQEALQLHRQQTQQFQVQMNLAQQQRYLQQQRSQLQQQQQQQQQPSQQQQQSQLQQQQQQHLHHLHHHNHHQQHIHPHIHQQSPRPSKPLAFEPGVCARRLMQYLFNQRQRPQDNNIHFWRKFVSEFFAPQAKKRWCVSQYGHNGRQPTGVFQQDVWHCEICGARPGRGFETTVEVLPRLCKIKYDSGIVDELLFVDISNEYQLSSGLMVLEYGKAIQESIFEHLRVVREGQLRIIFSPELKVLLWEFCARGHDELLPRRQLVPQVTQLAAIVQKYQNAVNQNQNGEATLSLQELQTSCQQFVAAARNLTRTLEAPTVNDLGYTKRYVRCLQISEVVNSMKDLIDFSRENRTGPIESLQKFPRRTSSLGGLGNQSGLQVPPLEQSINDIGTTITSPTDSRKNIVMTPPHAATSPAVSGSTNAMPQIQAPLDTAPRVHQNSVPPLQVTLPNSLTSDDINTSKSLAPNSLPSLQQPSFSSLRHRRSSLVAGGQSSPTSKFSPMVHQGSLSSPVSLPHHSSQVNNANEVSNAGHAQLQEMAIPPQPNVGGSTHQVPGGTSATKMNSGLNGTMVSGTGQMVVKADALGNSTLNDALVSDNDSGGNIAVSSSFSDDFANPSFMTSNENGMMMNLGAALSLNQDSLMDDELLQSRSSMADEHGLSIHDSSFLQDFGANDILSSGLPFWLPPSP